jgi:ribosomal protein S18 acetylase RimI-like enzyme
MTATTIIECIDFRPGWEAGLGEFFGAIKASGELAFFNPHPHDPDTLRRIAGRTGADLHCLLVEGRAVVGYGLLRGWDEGYPVPSLGIAVHPNLRAIGLGSVLMEYLEMMAAHRGATSVRLRVMRDNAAAVSLYSRRGYRLEPDAVDGGLLVGLKPLRGARV